MDTRIIDLAAERRRRRPEPVPTADITEAVDMIGLAGSAWLVGWLSLSYAVWRSALPHG